MIKADKWTQLRQWMAQLGINEDKLVEKFIIGSGRGGQKLHKTASCVYLHDPASGITVKCQESRLRESNRFYARRRLCEKVEAIQLGDQSTEQKRREKIRRQKRKRSKRAKEKMLENKSHRSGVKKLRQKPQDD